VLRIVGRDASTECPTAALANGCKRREDLLFDIVPANCEVGWIADIPEMPSKASPIIQSGGCTNCCLGTWSRSGTVWISGKPLKRLLSMHHVLNASKAAAAN
jgi:hypothetical protein